MSDHPDRVTLLFDTDIINTVFENCKECETCGTVQELSDKLVAASRDHFVRWALFISFLPYDGVLRSLKFDNRTINVCGKMKKFKDEPLGTDKALVRHLIVKLGRDIFRDQYLVYRNLLNAPQELVNQMQNVFDEIIENNECLSLKTLAVNGQDLMAAGVESGAQLGQILNELFEMVLNDASLNEKETLLDIVKKLY
jgi:tRNA nucleotidyltransferase (CCA-adding enzyme)